MRINGEFFIRNIAGDNVLIPIGNTALNFNGMIILNETGTFVWKLLVNGETNKDSIIRELIKDYEIDEDTANQDLEAYLKNLVQEGILIE